jgi:Flp pilus assembly protein TadD
MESVPPLAREAIEHARRRDFDKALATASKALEQHSNDMGLQLFVGLLHTRLMQFDLAIPHLRVAMALAPNDAAARLELARALMAVGNLDEAEQLLSTGRLPLRDVRLLQATISSRKGDVNTAIEGFRSLVEADSNDFESWANLGVTLLNAGKPGAAAEALGKSLELRPDRPRVLDKWAEAHVAARNGEAALLGIRAQLSDRPDDVLLIVSAARLEDLLGRPEKAVEHLERAIRIDPRSVAALCALADLYERQNEINRFAEVIAALATVAPNTETLPLLQATLALRHGKLEEAMKLAQSSSPVTDPGSRAHLIGKIYDRQGRAEEAWEAYSIMNREDARAVARASAEASKYRHDLDTQFHEMTSEWAEGWTEVEKPASEPIFLVGFPRSGTTLLDTFLMGHGDLLISEENPMLQTISDAAKDLKELPHISADAVKNLRELYFEEATKYIPGWEGKRLVDKLPFALVAGPHIHRLFPGAPIIFVERHPCDVVLSCYFNRFVPSGPGSSFVDLVDTAKLYDGMMRFWVRSRERLALRVHEVRYERMVEDTETELRGVAGFLGLDWSDDLVDNRQTAAKRGFIRTPSYAQVTEGVYKRSVARWARYRKEFEPVLPILEPWIRHLGYET